MQYRYYFFLFIALVATLVPGAAWGQAGASVYPPEIYSGENILTVKAPNGIKQIQVAGATANVIISGAGAVSCKEEQELRVTVTNADAAQIQLIITDCRNHRVAKMIPTGKPWNIDRVSFGVVEEGRVICQEFQVRAVGDLFGDGEPIFLDAITIAEPNASIRLPGVLPVKINPGTTYVYQVCYKAEEIGTHVFPVTTWIRRRYPVGDLVSYPVADTGFVRVVPKRVTPDTVPPPRPDTARFSYTPPPEEPAITDPTTFRSVAVPNAVIPKRGKLYLGVYDLLGLTAGYSLDDHLMVIAGGAIPTPDDWSGARGDIFGAYSLGVKMGIPLANDLDVAAGYQWGRSFYDRQNAPDTVRSEITVQAPYGAISYGDDDSRLSATFGYAFKHHSKKLAEFNQNAAFIAIGGDYRIGRHWKLAGELISMESLGVMPIIATARYFTSSFAVDFGIGYVGITTGDNRPPAIPLVPVVSGVFTF